MMTLAMREPRAFAHAAQALSHSPRWVSFKRKLFSLLHQKARIAFLKSHLALEGCALLSLLQWEISQGWEGMEDRPAPGEVFFCQDQV